MGNMTGYESKHDVRHQSVAGHNAKDGSIRIAVAQLYAIAKESNPFDGLALLYNWKGSKVDEFSRAAELALTELKKAGYSENMWKDIEPNSPDLKKAGSVLQEQAKLAGDGMLMELGGYRLKQPGKEAYREAAEMMGLGTEEYKVPVIMTGAAAAIVAHVMNGYTKEGDIMKDREHEFVLGLAPTSSARSRDMPKSPQRGHRAGLNAIDAEGEPHMATAEIRECKITVNDW